MNHLRDQIISAFSTGDDEELAVALTLLFKLSSPNPQNHEAGPDFRDQAGSANEHDD